MGITQGSRPVLLLVEDDELLRMITAQDLQDNGYEVLEAAGAADAVKLLQQQSQSVALMVSDIRMPGEMDGIQLADWVQEHYPDIRILLISGWHGREEWPARHEFLAKPFRPQHLQQVLLRLLHAK